MPEVRIEEAQRFMEDCLEAVGAPGSEARAHTELLLHADLAGHFSHGLNRLEDVKYGLEAGGAPWLEDRAQKEPLLHADWPIIYFSHGLKNLVEFYIADIKSGATNPSAKPVILKESAATAWVDGCQALGATVGNYCMDLAVRKAKESGVGWVSAKRCNHFGMAGWWAKKAEKEGLIGMAFTNSSPIVVPTRAKLSVLGTNPIAMCAPAGGGDSLMVDIATSSVALGKIEVQIHKQQPIPNGWALGPDGQPTTDSQLAFNTGQLLPLGGLEETSGYKGYCLSAMVEAFCSGLSASNSTPHIPRWSIEGDGVAPDLGQCYAAIDPNCFAPGFGDRMAECLRTWRNMEPVDPSLPVLAPGDKERQHEKLTRARGTVIYAQGQIDACNAMAERLHVAPLKTE